MEPALCTAEAELAETRDALDKSQNALMDCQEMLEELQAFGEKQEAELTTLREELHVTWLAHEPCRDGNSSAMNKTSCSRYGATVSAPAMLFFGSASGWPSSS